MRGSRLLVLIAALLVAAFAPGYAAATDNNNESAVYQWHMEVPNVSMAADGSTAAVTGMGTFSVHDKTATGGGSFTLSNPAVSGTYVALDTISFEPYGCGVVRGNPLPPNFCGGKLMLDVLLTPTGGGASMEGTLTIICIIGDVPGQYFVSRNATEGITLDVPGVNNYNKQVVGANVFIRTA